MSENEVWKDVVGFEGLYQVSNKGNVHSVERIVQGRKWGGQILKPAYDKYGYFYVVLCKNGMMKTKKIHRLVAETFIPNPNGLPQVNHIDEVKDNNNVSNLEWCTREHNINHGTRNERVAQAQSKKVRAVNVKTGEVTTFNSVKEAGRKGYAQGHVSEACRGIYCTTGNLYKDHRWSYMEAE